MGTAYGTDFLDICFSDITSKFVSIPVEEKLFHYTVFLNLVYEDDYFLQVLDNQVYFWSKDSYGKFVWEQYDGPHKKEYLNAKNDLYGDAPYTFFDGLEGYNILLPTEKIKKYDIDFKIDMGLKYTSPGDHRVEVSSMKDFYIRNTRGIEELESEKEEFADDPQFEDMLDFQKQILKHTEICWKYKLMLVLP